ncbi:tripartite tricarboxylate transporter TctB family protein [Anaerotignum neopropionicum]|uniref:Tripartite tricarboxylate transporter TctB family protein n=1 Tax=Anaerotignum neopropionicum TaxID=36847 RepID=A0A136WGH6_9FIRM|nr:tripartite tricarboxylate transporter TctB family protein [Anaerotignum neopropionicum]KXL53449.1 tripartite tricarboxylate transporter TctB family protein [Anaerotignum neopropionicum]
MKKGNIVFSLICIVLGLYIIIVTMGYPKAAVYGTGVPGPGMWPGIIAGCLVVVSMVLLIKSIRMPKEVAEKVSERMNGSKRVLITMIGLVAYVALLNILGFIISTVVMLFAFIQWFSRGKIWESMLISVVTTLFIYCVFRFLLNVPVNFGLFYF